MAEEIALKVLEYLKKKGPTNTFRLATVLGIERTKILDQVQKLEKKEAVMVQAGLVAFLRFPRQGKVITKKPAKPPAPKKRAKPRHPAPTPRVAPKLKALSGSSLTNLQTENQQLKERLQSLEQDFEKLEHKVALPLPAASAPGKLLPGAPPPMVSHLPSKIAASLPAKTAPPPATESKALQAKLLQLEEKVKKLEHQAAVPPKIVRKLIKRVSPHPKKRKLIKIVSPPPPKIKRKKKRLRPSRLWKKGRLKKLKTPALKTVRTFLKNIQQLKKPEFIKGG